MADLEIDGFSENPDAIESAAESAAEPAKRPRGRPRGSGKARASYSAPGKINPADFAGSVERETGEQKTGWRGRRARASAGAEKEPVSLGESVEKIVAAAPVDQNAAKQIAETLLMMHNLAATALSMPEFALSPDEGQMLGLATASVARHYKWSGMAEKTKDWLMLAGALGVIYPPRFRAARERIRAAKTVDWPVKKEAVA